VKYRICYAIKGISRNWQQNIQNAKYYFMNSQALQILAKQMYEADINIIIENGPLYCNILVGKAPFWQQQVSRFFRFLLNEVK
jgi:hypothetical protein